MKNRYENIPLISKSERLGIALIIFHLFWWLFIPIAWKGYSSLHECSSIAIQEDTIAKKDPIAIKKPWKINLHDKKLAQAESEDYQSTEMTLLPFDPNKFSDSIGRVCKIPRGVRRNILKYIHAGGQFKTSEDLLKIYGMTPALFQRLRPYLKLPLVSKKIKELPIDRKSILQSRDLNKITVHELLQTLHIDTKLAFRMAQYRSLLGGFVDLNQLKEIYEMPDSIFLKMQSRLKIETQPKKIFINLADFQQLNKHPYIRYNNAKLILAYKKQHGMITNLDFLQPNYIKEPLKFELLKKYINYSSDSLTADHFDRLPDIQR